MLVHRVPDCKYKHYIPDNATLSSVEICTSSSTTAFESPRSYTLNLSRA